MSAWKRLSDNRLNVLTYYGGRCTCCWQPVLEVLQIIRDDGTHYVSEREDKEHTYNRLVAQAFPAGYSVMCKACVVARRKYRGKCPHEELSVGARALLRAVNAKIQSLIYPKPD